MIPSWLTPKVFGAGVIVALVIALGVWGSGMMVERNLARAAAIAAGSELKTEQGKVRDWKTKFDQLEAITHEQSAGINALFDAQVAADKKHAQELAAAKSKAQPMKDRASATAGWTPPPGKDPNTETRAYIDGLLRQERGQ